MIRPMPRMSFRFGSTGIAAGFICLATLYLIEMYGPGSYSSSGSGTLAVDGTFTITTSSASILPQIAQAAFIAFLLPLICGVVAIFRKENIYVALGSFCYGLAPIPIYTIGIFFTSIFFFGVTVPVFGIYVFNKLLNHNEQSRHPNNKGLR